MVDTLVELQDIISLDSYTCNFRLTLKQMDKKNLKLFLAIVGETKS